MITHIYYISQKLLGRIGAQIGRLAILLLYLGLSTFVITEMSFAAITIGVNASDLTAGNKVILYDSSGELYKECDTSSCFDAATGGPFTLNAYPVPGWNFVEWGTGETDNPIIDLNITDNIYIAFFNGAPVAVGDTYATDEDTDLNVAAPGVLGNDTDVDGNGLTAAVVSGPLSGVLTLNADGSFSYTPNADFNGSDSFTYAANDGTVDSNEATVTITVNPINDTPVAVGDTYATDEDTDLNVAAPGVLGNDTDVDGNGLTAAVVSGPLSGVLTLNADGSFSYTPNADFNGSDSFTYAANDGTVDSNEATVTITVNPINDTPVAVGDTYATDEDTDLNVAAPGVLGNDTDVDGNGLTAAVVSGPLSGVLTLNADGSFSYTPNADFNGSDSFTYAANDGTVDSNEATVTITVNPINDTPVAVGDTYATDEDTDLNVAAPGVLGNDTDVDGNGLTAAVVSGPLSGVLTLNADGSFSYTPNADFNGSDSFTYAANDGTVDSNEATVTITVNPINDTPVAVGDTYATDEDTDLNVAAPGVLGNDTDVDGNGLTAAVVSGPLSGVLTLNADGSFSYTPNADFNGSDSFTYAANDGTVDSNEATVTITVNPINDTPVAVGDTYATDEDTDLNVAAPGVLGNDTDVDGNGLTAAVVSGPLSGVLTLNADGSFSYTPNADFNGSDSFTYAANDGTVDSNEATVTITVNPINDTPVAVGDTYATDEDTDLNVAVPGVLGNDTDVDGNGLTAAVVSGPLSGVLTLNADGSFSYTPNADFNGSDSFTYAANDGTVDSNEATVTITVNPINDTPVAVGDTYATDEDTDLNVAAPGVLGNDTDVDVDFLTAALVSGTSNGLLTLNADGSFTYTPNGNFNGADSFTYKANDGNLDSNVTTVTITVNPVNDAPVADDDAYATDEDIALTVSAPGVLDGDSDIDGDVLTATVLSGPSSGTLTLNADGSFTYTPNANFNGSDSFTYTMSDGHGGSDTAAVTITVNAVNDPPVAENNAATTDEDAAVTTVNVLGNDNDVEGDTLSVSSFDSASTAGGTVAYNGDGTFTYTPPDDFNGTDKFTYKANDGFADSNSADVTIQVYAVNDAPSFAGGGDQNAMENAGTQTVTSWATNILAGPANESAQKLTFSVSNTNNAIFSDQPSIDPGTGTLTYTPVSEGTATVTVVLRDNGGTDRGGVDQSAPQTFEITVTDSDPVAEIQYTITSDPPVEPMDVVFNDNTISYDGINRTWDFGDGITSSDSNPTHNYNHQGTYTVTLTVVEPDGDTDTATTTITVADAVPEADFLAAPSAGPVPLVVAFENRTDTTAEKPDPLSVIIWDFGDGATQTSVENPVHTYGTPGSYTVTLTVRDSDGSEDSASIIVTAEAVENDTDADGDGWYISQGDCNDNDATINPGATEICGDGIDQDCFDGDRDCATLTGCIDLADTPLEVNTASGTANIMLAIDDSGSMDWEIMTTDGDDGLFWIGNDDYYYLYESDDNVNSPSVWPVLGKFDSNANKDEANEVQRRMWKARWSGYNVIYYNPAYEYEPWYGESERGREHAQGASDAGGGNPKPGPQCHLF